MLFMKTSLYLLLAFNVLLVTMSCHNTTKQEGVTTEVVNNPASGSGVSDTSSLPVMKFGFLEHDFGQIIQGEKVSIAFKFKNTGKSDLVIASANAGCGCTVPSYPKNPIKAGAEGAVEISFNSSGKRGFQSQRVSVVANTQPNTTVLTIKSNVVVPEN